MSITTTNDDAKKSVNTLAIDVGGTGIKASVLDDTGQMECARVRVETPYPLPPQRLIGTIADLVRELPSFDRISLGFPGMVREGIVLTAPHFVSPSGPGGKVATDLLAGWTGFNLAKSLSVALAKPAKVANDADLQGAAVIEGNGLELVVTLGTGVGTALYYQGRLCPHLELAHHPFRKERDLQRAARRDHPAADRHQEMDHPGQRGHPDARRSGDLRPLLHRRRQLPSDQSRAGRQGQPSWTTTPASSAASSSGNATRCSRRSTFLPAQITTRQAERPWW